MRNDPIVAEVRKVREAHAAKFEFDLKAIYLDLKSKERTSGRKYVRFQPRPSRMDRKTAAAQTP